MHDAESRQRLTNQEEGGDQDGHQWFLVWVAPGRPDVRGGIVSQKGTGAVEIAPIHQTLSHIIDQVFVHAQRKTAIGEQVKPGQQEKQSGCRGDYLMKCRPGIWI